MKAFLRRPVGVVAATLIASVSLAPAPARAQGGTAEEDKEAVKRAREQFTQALSLQTAGDFAGALTLLKEVAAVKPTPQVRFNIALCEEKLGRLVAALGDYELAAADARENDADVAKEVDARLEALQQRIPKIVVQRGQGAETASIMLDGVALGDSVVGSSMPADPGPHVIEAKATGYEPFRRNLRLQEQQTETVVVDLTPLPAESQAPPTTKTVVVDNTSPLRTIGFVTAGVGAASLIASGVFFYLRGQTIDELDGECPTMKTCPESERDTFDKGKTYNTVGNVTLAVGAVALAAGIPMIVLGSKSSSEQVSLVPAASDAQAGLSLTGKFF